MSLDRLLRPKSVAVIGASTTPSFVSQTLANLEQHGFLKLRPVEVLADTRLLLPPVSDAEAVASLRGLRGYPMLAGVRGRPARDVPALVDTMRRFAELCGDIGDLVDEIDLNPILVRAAGRGLSAVDWLIVRRSETRGG